MRRLSAVRRRGFAAIIWVAALAAVILAGAALAAVTFRGGLGRELGRTAEAQARRTADGELVAAVAGLDAEGTAWRPAAGARVRVERRNGRLRLSVAGHAVRLDVTVDDTRAVGDRVTRVVAAR